MQIAGVELRSLETHGDERGSVTEVFRASWLPQPYVQWNHVRSAAGILRGVHGHFRHADYLVLLEGRALFGLKDVRAGSPTEGAAALVELRGESLQTLSIPAGVAHGFYFPQPSTLIYAVTHYWDTEDELGCRWDDPELGIPWPVESVQLSERDAVLPSFRVFAQALQQRMAKAAVPPK